MGERHETIHNTHQPTCSTAGREHRHRSDHPGAFSQDDRQDRIGRYDGNGNPKPDFILNQPEARGARILLAGDNFGCGSSREHAPWALVGFGFRAVISTSFADIFRNNALKNELLPVVVDRDTHWQLFSLVEEEPATQLVIDLAGQTLTLPDGRAVTFPIDSFSRGCLLQGVDELGYLLARMLQIDAYEGRMPDAVRTVA